MHTAEREFLDGIRSLDSARDIQRQLDDAFGNRIPVPDAIVIDFDDLTPTERGMLGGTGIPKRRKNSSISSSPGAPVGARVLTFSRVRMFTTEGPT